MATAVDGVQAIELAEKPSPTRYPRPPHAALDGVSTAARLRRDHPSICLIALTGDHAPGLHRAVRGRARTTPLKSQIPDALVERPTSARAG